ncbi:hypothetical protein ACFLYH_02305 [Candidatus Dependentiae bacterium]
MSDYFFKKNLILVLMVFSVSDVNASKLNLRSSSSAIKINSNASFSIENAASTSTGKIIIENNGTIQGEKITFEDGKVEEEDSKMNISGTFYPERFGRIILNEGQKFSGKGGRILHPININGCNNILEGYFTITSDIIFQDSSSTATFDLSTRLGGNIRLNGGSLKLNNDLNFVDGKRIFGPGIVMLNGLKLALGAQDLSWNENMYFDNASDINVSANTNLESIWTFSGSSTLEGNKNVFRFGANGSIIVERGSSLLIKNVIFRDVSENSIFGMDNAVTITFQNVKFYQSQDYTFSIGHFEILDKLKICGGHKFTYKSSERSTILSNSFCYLDKNVTFSYDPPIADRELIVFDDDSSALLLNGATIHATLTGMHLKKGTMIIDRVSYFCSEKSDNSDIGITLGNDSLLDDFSVQFLGAANLEMTSGSIFYRNVDLSSWVMDCESCVLQIDTNCRLGLYQSLSLGRGRLDFVGNSILARAEGKNIIGGINAIGRLSYQDL